MIEIMGHGRLTDKNLYHFFTDKVASIVNLSQVLHPLTFKSGHNVRLLCQP